MKLTKKQNKIVKQLISEQEYDEYSRHFHFVNNINDRQVLVSNHLPNHFSKRDGVTYKGNTHLYKFIEIKNTEEDMPEKFNWRYKLVADLGSLLLNELEKKQI